VDITRPTDVKGVDIRSRVDEVHVDSEDKLVAGDAGVDDTKAAVFEAIVAGLDTLPYDDQKVDHQFDVEVTGVDRVDITRPTDEKGVDARSGDDDVYLESKDKLVAGDAGVDDTQAAVFEATVAGQGPPYDDQKVDQQFDVEVTGVGRVDFTRPTDENKVDNRSGVDEVRVDSEDKLVPSEGVDNTQAAVFGLVLGGSDMDADDGLQMSAFSFAGLSLSEVEKLSSNEAEGETAVTGVNFRDLSSFDEGRRQISLSQVCLLFYVVNFNLGQMCCVIVFCL